MILLNDPDRVKKDGELAFVSALWFWMTPQVGKTEKFNKTPLISDLVSCNFHLQ